MLEGGQAFNQASAVLMEEERGTDAGAGVAEAVQDGGPTVDAVSGGRAEVDVEFFILVGDGVALGIAGEDIRTGDKALERDGIFVARLEADLEAIQHFFDGVRMAFGDPTAGRVFRHDTGVAIGIPAGEEDDGVMVEAVIEGGEPFDIGMDVKMVHDMNIASEGGEELAGGDIPIAMEPGAALPAGEFVEGTTIIDIGERVIIQVAEMKRVSVSLPCWKGMT